jgi:hypothetical protein
MLALERSCVPAQFYNQRFDQKRVFSIHDFDSKFIRESVYACAELIVDEEEHNTLNRMVELNKTLTDSIRKRHKKEDSALCTLRIENT